MRFLSVFKAVETGKPPSPEIMEKMGKLVEDSMRKGEVLATEGCLPSALGVRVRKTGDKLSVKDGPFTESKEVIGGECEIRQIYEGPM